MPRFLCTGKVSPAAVLTLLVSCRPSHGNGQSREQSGTHDLAPHGAGGLSARGTERMVTPDRFRLCPAVAASAFAPASLPRTRCLPSCPSQPQRHKANGRLPPLPAESLLPQNEGSASPPPAGLGLEAVSALSPAPRARAAGYVPPALVTEAHPVLPGGGRRAGARAPGRGREEGGSGWGPGQLVSRGASSSGS